MEHNGQCPIWGTPANVSRNQGGGYRVWSDRTGGGYRISEVAAEDYGTFTPEQAAIITTWLVDQRRIGDRSPIVNAQGLEDILKRRPLRYSQRVERFFRFLSAHGYTPASTVKVANDYPTLDIPFHSQHLMAWLEVKSFEEGAMFLRLLAEEGYFREPHFQNGTIILTSKGWEKLEDIEATPTNSLQAFVAMWFDSEMNDAWRLGIAPAVRDAGYEPLRIDGKEHNNKIDDEIVAEIKRSRFLIADFTCGGVTVEGIFSPNPRGGVYYEAGLAHGLGMEVIFTCREDRMNYAHFDTRQFAHIVWKTPDELRQRLYNRIAATVREAPGAPGRGRSPAQ